jgi:transcriptional regulator with XRE-family HTH domain
MKNMRTKKTIILPKHKLILEEMGQNIKLARKRRKLLTTQVAERSDVSRSTLFLIEQGDEGVSIGNYFNVLKVLGLEMDFLKLALDDILGRKLQDLELLTEPEYTQNPLKIYSNSIRSKILLSLKRGGYSIDSEVYDILGCEYSEFIKHLNNNEYNFKVNDQDIDLDHIIPIIEGNSKEKIKQLNHYTNLQLLPSIYNRTIKGMNKWDVEHFRIWFNTIE